MNHNQQVLIGILVSGITMNNQLPEGHKEVLELIFDRSKGMDEVANQFIQRFECMKANDQYWIIMTAAFVVSNAQRTGAIYALCDRLNGMRFSSNVCLIPLNMIGTMRAVNLMTPYGWSEDVAFEKCQLHVVSRSLKHYIEGSLAFDRPCSRDVVRLFSEYLSEYLGENNRAKVILDAIEHLRAFPPGASKLIEELNHRVLGILSVREQSTVLQAALSRG